MIDFAESYDYNHFENCFEDSNGIVWANNGKSLISFPADWDDEEYELPDMVEEVYFDAFRGSLVKRVHSRHSVSVFGKATNHKKYTPAKGKNFYITANTINCDDEAEAPANEKATDLNASFIRIRDMFALMNASDNRFNLPEFADDYEALWKIYTGEYLNFKKFENGVGNWNRLCMCLDKYESDQKPLAKMTISTSDSPSYKTLTYFLPEFCFTTVKMLIQKLMEYGIAEKESNIMTHTSDTCKLELRINGEYEQALNAVFINPQLLLPYYGIDVRKYKAYNSDYVEIKCNNLTVTDANLDVDGTGRQKFAFGVLQQLEKEHFVSQLKQNATDPRLVSFVYPNGNRTNYELYHVGRSVEKYPRASRCSKRCNVCRSSIYNIV